MPDALPNFALVGCGRLAAKHAQLLASGAIKGARLAAVSDGKAERAEAFGRTHGVPHFRAKEEMAESPAGGSTSSWC